MAGGGADPGGWGGVTLGGARPPCPVRPGPPPLSPRSLGPGTAPGPDDCSARPPALRLHSRRPVVFGRCGSCAHQTDCCSRSEAAGALGALQGGRQAPGPRWVSRCWRGNGHVDSGQPRSSRVGSVRPPRSRRRC